MRYWLVVLAFCMTSVVLAEETLVSIEKNEDANEVTITIKVKKQVTSTDQITKAMEKIKSAVYEMAGIPTASGSAVISSNLLTTQAILPMSKPGSDTGCATTKVGDFPTASGELKWAAGTVLEDGHIVMKNGCTNCMKVSH